MVVDDFDVFDAFGGRDKANAPLIIDPDRVLPFSTTLECFKAIPRLNAKVIEGFGVVELLELAKSG